MPGARSADDSGDDAPAKPTLGERLKSAVLKPAPPASDGGASPEPAPPPTVEELEARVKSADDKERALGLIGAPLAGGIGLLIINALIADNPAAPNKAHVNPSVYHELALVLVALAIVMLVMALLRKRLFLGMAFALYGLAVFNLHYWGFGVPFILAGAWLLVRAYRVQRDLREAGGGTGRSGGAQGAASSRPQPNKRYTPKATPPKRATSTKPDDQKKAG